MRSTSQYGLWLHYLARAPPAAMLLPLYPEHQEIPAAAWVPSGSGDGMVSALASTLKGAKISFAPTNVRFGSRVDGALA